MLNLEILPTGEIKFPRSCTKEEQEFLLNIFSVLISDDKKIEEIRKFFEENDNRKLILGKEILCG